MAQNKTTATPADVDAFLQQVEPEKRRQDGLILKDLFQRESGFTPTIWGASIIGYGRYHYKYASGREGDHLATGFSPRKARLSIYIMPGYHDYSELLANLGKHRLGKSCVYINKLEDIDIAVLGQLIRAGLRDLDAIWPVLPE